MDVVPVTGALTEVAVYAGCEPAQQAEVARLMVEQVRRLRDHGPTPDELHLERRRTRHMWTERPDELEVAAEAAVCMLLGEVPVSLADRLEAVGRLDAAAVARTAAGHRTRPPRQPRWPACCRALGCRCRSARP